MSIGMKFGSKDIPFVYKGDKLIYPNPIKDGLLLWYNFKGMRNTDTNKEIAKDLSGNNNDGTLTNFNFTEGSGYSDNKLVLDGIDDSLTIPDLLLDETAMSVMHDGKLYAYEDDKVLTVGDDGEISNIPKNILRGSDLSVVHPRSSITSLSSYSKDDEIIVRSEKIESDGTASVFGFETRPGESSFTEGEYITLSFEARGNVRLNYVFLIRPSGGNSNLYLNTDGMNEQEFKRFSITVKAPFTTDSGNILVASTEGLGGEAWFEVKRPKLEKGVNATQWIRNPKDYQTTTLIPASLTDLQLYNKTLHKDELLHNAESKGLKQLKDGVVVQDGLVLHYDFSHESNTSEYKGKAFDYSGNGNHGELMNFNYTAESGYGVNKLLFDGVDDYLEVPETGLNPESMAVASNGQVYSYDGDIVNYIDYEGMMKTGNINLFSIEDVRRAASYKLTVPVEPNTDYTVSSNIPVASDGTIIYFNSLNTSPSGVWINNPKTINSGSATEMYVQIFSGRQYSEQALNGDFWIMWEKSSTATPWTRSVKDYNRATLSPKIIQDLLLYNRPLTPEEIQHNYQIEKLKYNL